MNTEMMHRRREIVARIDYARYQRDVKVSLLCSMLGVTMEVYLSALYDQDADVTPLYQALSSSTLGQLAVLLHQKPVWLVFGSGDAY